MKTLLLVEDEREILENNQRFFTSEGYRVLAAENLAQAREHLSKETPNAIVLDIMLPDGNGLDLLCELRESGSAVPIIMLTAWGKSSDVARGLKLGANDYMSKPFTYELLQARVETMFRNVEQMPERIARGPLSLDVLSGQAFLNNEDLLLAKKEFQMLALFIQYEGKSISDDFLYEKIWKQPMNYDSKSVKNTVSRLRKKLEGSGFTISSIYGDGYIFEKV